MLFHVLSEYSLSWFLFSLDRGIKHNEEEVQYWIFKGNSGCKKKMEGEIKSNLNNRGKEKPTQRGLQLL